MITKILLTIFPAMFFLIEVTFDCLKPAVCFFNQGKCGTVDFKRTFLTISFFVFDGSRLVRIQMKETNVFGTSRRGVAASRVLPRKYHTLLYHLHGDSELRNKYPLCKGFFCKPVV